MKLVAVTSCPVGMAHTFMASAALKEAAKKLGIDIKVETQGMTGISNRVTQSDIQEADAAILTNDAVIEEQERFEGLPVYTTSTSKIIKNVNEIIQETIALIKKEKP
jgi:fructose-specific phosphotransferase system IIB component